MPRSESTQKHGTLVILSGSAAIVPASSPGISYALWDCATPSGRVDCVSLPALLGVSQESLFRRYVAWRDGLSRETCGGKRLADALDLSVAGGGALWWASAIAATPLESLGRVADILKLAALEEWIRATTLDRITYGGQDRLLRKVLRDWCKHLRIDFMETPGSAFSVSSDVPRELPHLLDALRYLSTFVLKRRSMRSWRRVRGARERSSDMVIATFFPNIELAAAESGRFESRYWGRMHTLLSELQINVRWIWFFSASPQMSLPAAVSLRNRFNEDSTQTRQAFSFLEEEVGPAGLARAIGIYFRLMWNGFRFRRLKSTFRLPGSAVDFFPLLKRDWRSSFFGAHAMYVALYAVACRSVLRGKVVGTTGLMYLWENQGWEFLLLDGWKAEHRAPAWGVAHTPACSSPTVLRNRLGEAQCQATTALGPDQVIAGGAKAVDELTNCGWPKERVGEAEAVRYEHLAGKRNAARRSLPASDRQLLVLTGIVRSEAKFVLDLLTAVAQQGGLDQFSSVLVKAHPFARIDDLVADLRLRVDAKVTTGAIEALCAQADVVVSGFGTSAWIDVAWLGVPLILVEAMDRLYPTPIRLEDGFQTVQTAEHLARQLRDPARVSVDDSLFTFSADLARWRALLLGAPGGPMRRELGLSPGRP